ncbi:cobinamide kinase [Candidatus Moduliflexus flocculans]|uniref:Adenosylcobinamide kinase n=1 Tax=Candidatus Moduliflexus flocculans TaxID=1499966 RepID=A0A081BSK2_9BACT|nr:cobinamide kinase [Candidatus Moduliflexus flocculans]
MTRTILITGGARSGKSRFAESLLLPHTDVVYIATSDVSDDEMRDRVWLHQQRRPATWRTFEGVYQLRNAVCDARYYLLDCLSILTSRFMFDLTRQLDRIPIDAQTRVEDAVFGELRSLQEGIAVIGGTLVIVTNEVGLSIVPENHVARVYRDILGKVNQRVAAMCDEVYLVVCGIPMKIK